MLSTLRFKYEITFQAPFHNGDNLRTFLVPSAVVQERCWVDNVFILIALLKGGAASGISPKIMQESWSRAERLIQFSQVHRRLRHCEVVLLLHEKPVASNPVC